MSVLFYGIAGLLLGLLLGSLIGEWEGHRQVRDIVKCLINQLEEEYKCSEELGNNVRRLSRKLRSLLAKEEER